MIEDIGGASLGVALGDNQNVAAGAVVSDLDAESFAFGVGGAALDLRLAVLKDYGVGAVQGGGGVRAGEHVNDHDAGR